MKVLKDFPAYEEFFQLTKANQSLFLGKARYSEREISLFISRL